MTAVRPDATTGKCPNGSQACSDKLSPQNIICVNDLADCPITDINFVESGDIQPYIDNPDYNVVDYLPQIPERSAVSIVWTSKDVDSLPVMRTNITQYPCLNPQEMYQQDEKEYYLLERNKNVTTCSDQKGYRDWLDDRYTASIVDEAVIGLNEWEI